MKKQSVFMITVFAVLLPLQAMAACFSDGSALYRIKTVPVVNTPFGVLVGEAFNICGTSENSMLFGNSHARPDGHVHFGLSVTGSATCPPYYLEGVVNVTTGAGSGNMWVDSTPTPVNISAAPGQCPPAQ